MFSTPTPLPASRRLDSQSGFGCFMVPAALPLFTTMLDEDLPWEDPFPFAPWIAWVLYLGRGLLVLFLLISALRFFINRLTERPVSNLVWATQSPDLGTRGRAQMLSTSLVVGFSCVSFLALVGMVSILFPAHAREYPLRQLQWGMSFAEVETILGEAGETDEEDIPCKGSSYPVRRYYGGDFDVLVFFSAESELRCWLRSEEIPSRGMIMRLDHLW